LTLPGAHGREYVTFSTAEPRVRSLIVRCRASRVANSGSPLNCGGDDKARRNFVLTLNPQNSKIAFIVHALCRGASLRQLQLPGPTRMWGPGSHGGKALLQGSKNR
jgi:hypothetical protein